MEDNLMERRHTNDHDLLIRIDEKLEIMIKASGDQETRLRRLETWGAMAIGIGYALQFYFNFLRK